MLNLLEDYISRSLPEQGEFQTNPNLLKKVDWDGNFLPFYGARAAAGCRWLDAQPAAEPRYLSRDPS